MSTVAKIISVIFHPLLNPVVAFILLVATDEKLHLVEKFKFAGVAILFCCVFVVAYNLYLIKKGIVESPEMVIREQRPRPLTVVAIILFIGFGVLSLIHAPNLVRGLMFCYASNTLIVALISYWWKVSIHAAGIACPLVALTYRFGSIVLPFYLLVLLVCVSRVILKRHTVAQVVVGALLGFILTALQLSLFCHSKQRKIGNVPKMWFAQ